jgi:Tol biopolymer transport system component
MSRPPETSAGKPDDRLDGWKQIAFYLGKDKRTARRWELTDGLPLFREGGKVFAHPADLDRWRAGRIVGPSSEEDEEEQEKPAPPCLSAAPSLRRRISVGRALTLALALAALGLIVAWQYWPTDAQILACLQLTRDGRHKDVFLSTDGKQIYFNEIGSNIPRIASVPIGGGNVSYLPVAPGIINGISVSRNSLLVTEPISFRLFELSLATLDRREIPLPPGISAGHAAWNPAGNRIAIASDDTLAIIAPWESAAPFQQRFSGIVADPCWEPHSGRLRFCVLNSKSGASQWWELARGDRQAHPVPEFSVNRTERSGSWSDGGHFFAYQSSRGDASQIWVSTASQAYPVTLDGRTWNSPVFVPHSNTILATAGPPQGRLSVLTGNAFTEKPVLAGVPAYELDYSHDGKSIVYTLYPEHSIWRCNLDGSEPRQLTPAGLVAHQPHWSPDDTRIAFMGKPTAGGQWRVYLEPSAGGSLDQPLPEGDDQGVPTWSADGRDIFFGDLRVPSGFDLAAIHKLHLQTRTVSNIVAPVGLWSPRMSPDGKYLAAVGYDNRSIYIRDNAREKWWNCVSMHFLAEPIWTRDSSMIQFQGISTQSDMASLYRVDARCHEPTHIVDLSPYRFLGEAWFGIMPDGSPIGLLRIPDEIYAIEWCLRRRLP